MTCNHTVGLVDHGYEGCWFATLSTLAHEIKSERKDIRLGAKAFHKVLELDDLAFAKKQLTMFSYCPDCGVELTPQVLGYKAV